MKVGIQLLELTVACVVLAFGLTLRMGWSSDVGPIMPVWARLILPCLLLLPIRPRAAAYWLDRMPWAIAIGLFLFRNTLPGALGILTLFLWSCLAVRAALGLWNRKRSCQTTRSTVASV
jgi:hypothetical protein